VAILFSLFGIAFLSPIGAQESWKLAFGSCSDPTKPLPIWKVVHSEKPNVWLWLGDSIYKDSFDPEEKRPFYELHHQNQDYRTLKSQTKIFGTWDDHDFGTNDIGSEYLRKKESQDAFLDFLEEPKDSWIRNQTGIYRSYEFKFHGSKIHLILLDTRTFRTPLKKSWLPILFKGYEPNLDPNSTMLGEAQWDWLQKELQKPSDFLLVASSIQFSNEGHPWEKWGNFPLEKQKLLSILSKNGAKEKWVLSGDRHIAEVFRIGQRDSASPFLIEITSSSMNKPLPWRQIQEDSLERISPVFPEANVGFLEFKKEKSGIKSKFKLVGLSGELFQGNWE